jgi:hypothetical protein
LRSHCGQPAVRLINRISAAVILITSFCNCGVQLGCGLVTPLCIIYMKSLINPRDRYLTRVPQIIIGKV